MTKLDSTGSGLVFSTYLGGSDHGSRPQSIAVDAAGSAYRDRLHELNRFPDDRRGGPDDLRRR